MTRARGRYYYFDSATGRYFWEDGSPAEAATATSGIERAAGIVRPPFVVAGMGPASGVERL